ncbi:hypothetical protein FN846DRAFT_781000 [Sphaerosporella brunnea]|uniref:Zinc finger PHD-type domain-containing protein n=1 Tax=Sphaerosporella brunnea TaxID=1250544 RepID=A0A5J5ERP0_9PEZI|nr:hypothetical protein FN846DRAFT_781000 [Sphaerosporella brunnea]
MTENPTAPSPPGLPHHPSNATSTPTPDETSDPGGGEIRCICDCNEDDGHTVCCDKCGTWQHVICMQIPEDTVLSESEYMCASCSPRHVEATRARELQRKRRRDEKNNRRKRSTTASHKKKEPPAGGVNGIAPGVAKLPSPREPQAPTTRKRNHRASHSSGHVGSGTGSPLHFPDAESDTDLEKYKFEFIDISNGQNKYTNDEAALWVDNLLDKMGDCACAGGSDCLLAKVKKCGGIESAATKRPLTNGHSKKHRVKRNPSSESNPSKEPTPDFHNDDDDSKPGVKVKPRSRDLTPSLPHEIAVDSGSMTGREARKFKDVLSRIEKQTQEEQVPPTKRRKRNSTASDIATARSASPGSGDDESRKSKSHEDDSPMSPASNGREVSVVDAGTGRSPGSSTGSHTSKSRHAKSPAASATSSKGRRKVKTKTSRPNYVDSSMQTEQDDELPWWKQTVPLTPPRPPRIPLRKRLMQSLLRDQEEAASAGGSTPDKKRKHESFAADTTVSLQASKIQKTAENEGAPQTSTNPGVSGPPPIVVKASASPNSGSGPALENLFADAERPRPKNAQAPNGTDKQQSNGVRPVGLHLTLPSPNAPSGPLSPGQRTSGSVRGQSPLSGVSASPFSPSVVASVNSGSAVASPSPTKTKKLSLQDYRKRHKPVDVPCEKK